MRPDIEHLHAHALELMAVEPLWKGLEDDRLCNFAPEDVHQLNEVVLGELEASRDDQPSLRNFFHAPDLPLPRASLTDEPKITELRTLQPFEAHVSRKKNLTVTDLGGIYRRPQVHYEIRWPQVLFQKQVIAKSLFLDLLTRGAGKVSHMTVNLSKEPLFEGQTGLTPQNP